MAQARICGVYCIRNTINGKCYIGSSTQIQQRWMNHRNSLKRNQHPNAPLQNDYNKYGVGVFEYKILEQLNTPDQATLFDREQYYMDNTENLYNICPKADGSEQAEETKRKHSEQCKGDKNPMHGKHLCGDKNPMHGKHLSEEARRKISERQKGENHWNYGRHWDEETKRKMSKTKKGKHHTEAARRKMSEQRKGGLNARAITVQCVETGKIYSTIKEAAIDTKGWKMSISKCCRGLQKTSGGYHWRYYKE